MSKYTTEVRYICENYAGLTESTGYGRVDEIIASARSKVFDFAYPIFDEDYRSVLETKILKHFYTREIGAETVGLWKLWLNTKMNEIMPYYNQLYKSELLEFNPLYDVDLTRERDVTSDGTKADTETSQGTRSSSGSNQTDNSDIVQNNGTHQSTVNDYFSDTPQGKLDNLEELSYLTNARLNIDSVQSADTSDRAIKGHFEYADTGENSATTKSDSVIRNTEDYLEHVKGKNGGSSYAKLLTEYRATFLNIDMQVINELSDLFMNLW